MMYATIDDLRKLFTGKHAFPESKVEDLESQLEVAEEYLRVFFSNAGRDLDSEVESGKVSSIIVRDVVSNMVKRSYMSSVGSVPDIEVSQVSQSAGPYSMSFSPVSSGSGFWLRRDERKLLGLSGSYSKSIKMF